MSLPDHIWKALRNEFIAWYEVSELPDAWDEWIQNELKRSASASASRLRRAAKDTNIQDISNLLREGSQARRGELVRHIEAWTRFGWSDEDEDWTALQQILNAIADHLNH